MELEKVSNIRVSLGENTKLPDFSNIVSNTLIVAAFIAFAEEIQSGSYNFQFNAVWLFAAAYGIILDMLPRSEKEQFPKEDNEIFASHEYTKPSS